MKWLLHHLEHTYPSSTAVLVGPIETRWRLLKHRLRASCTRSDAYAGMVDAKRKSIPRALRVLTERCALCACVVQVAPGGAEA